jgi:hypothetical protein
VNAPTYLTRACHDVRSRRTYEGVVEERTPIEAMVALRAVLSDRAFRREIRIGFGFKEGDRAVLRVGPGGARIEPWSRATDLSVLTNARTIWDLLLGEVDFDEPKEHQLFLWAGDAEAMRTLSSVLGGASSILDLRASSSKAKGKKR